MDGHTDLTGIAVVGLAALLCGMVMTRLRQPAVVGYILAGILLGPTAAGVVANQDQIRLLADLGVLMLLFMIGLELPVAEFVKVWRMALLIMCGQIAGFLAIALGLSYLAEWPWQFAVLLAFAAALSSTAVAIKMIGEIGETGSETGRLAVAVLIAQDLAVVPMMLIVGDMGGGGFSTTGAAKVALSAVLLTGLLVYFARNGQIKLPFAERIAAHPELRPVGAIACCLAAAALAGLFGVSAAYGAFIVGLILGNARGAEDLSHAAKPIEGLLMMVFFLSVGLLIDLDFIYANLGRVLSWLAIVTVVKTALNIMLIRATGRPWPQAFLAGVLLGQVGEFSFLLAAVGTDAGIVPPSDRSLLVAVIALSLLISPLWLATARRLHLVATRRGATLGLMLGYLFRGKWRRAAVRARPILNGVGNGARRVAGRLRPRHRKAPSPPATPANHVVTPDPARQSGSEPQPVASPVPEGMMPVSDSPASEARIQPLPDEDPTTTDPTLADDAPGRPRDA